MIRALTVGCCSILLIIASCSSGGGGGATAPAPDAASDGSSSDGPSSSDASTPTPSLQCEAGDLADATEVTPTAVNGLAPEPKGGTPKDGRYVLTKMTLYFPDDAATSVAPKTFKSSIEIAGTKIRRTASDSGSSSVFFSVGDFTTKGTSLETAVDCASDKQFENRVTKSPFSVTEKGIASYTLSAYTLVQEFELR